MAFDPKTNKFPYPIDTASHYLEVKKSRGIIFDENYPYIDNSKSFKRKRFWFYIFLFCIILPFVKLRLGLKVKGRKNLKKHKEIIKNGVVSVANHIHMWDYLAILIGVRYYKPSMLVWDKNINGPTGKLMRLVGGIPIPTNVNGMSKFMNDIDNHLCNKGWLHVYAEGSMWEYYSPIRPFKKGAGKFAVKNNVPILPLAFSYRKPSLLRKMLGQAAKITLNIGEPIFKDESLSGSEQEIDILLRCHKEICRLAGLDPNNNLYNALYNGDKRVDYYTKEYGVNYKGSW